VPLTGFSHGAAGYAYALDALAKATSSQDFMHASEQTVLYENEFYIPENNNWASIKSNGQLQTNGKKLSQWCYGSTGIGLGRIGQIKYGTSNKHHIQVQIENAKDGILGSKTHWADDSLCCGVASHIEFLSEVSKLHDDAELEQHAQKNLIHLINERRHCGAYNLGDFKGYDIPLGMFRGVTGIGYTILRRLEKSLPNVLIFE
jgi:lantibiotic modifying enzyme